jgi:hypothetical protein
MRNPKTNLFSALALESESAANALLAPKLPSNAAVLSTDRKERHRLRSKLASASGAATFSQPQGHMQHRRLGQRHR